MKMNREKLIAAAIGLGILSVIGVVGGRYVYNEYHTYYSPLAREFQAETVNKQPYVLETVKKELLGSTYASFVVKDEDTGEIIYQCPDLFRIKDLASIQWDENSYHIHVLMRDNKETEYIFDKNTWRK